MSLTTLEEYCRLSPLSQGYVVYMEAAHDGSELKGLSCPYPVESEQAQQWHEGQRRAVLEAQDADD